MLDFAIETFHETKTRVQVPKFPTLFEELRDLFDYTVVHRRGLISAMLMKDEDGNIYYSALFGVYVLPVLTVWGFYKLM